ncbi:alpha/beta hydrolase family protein [Lentibacter sp. XHP0401]|uniref:alpha/beta hydrolase family protein n=1 Tax=Lentibacter sp. XHP0401 TaxID=2984334 RepID=UPI0021E7C03F|nr:alpha/beta hydrolase [Lentibacter sp. XHP0401]MCV2894097.1 prolyl oligopeptidase family serine peptidase [Lentibacter sp. XHP0401]
MRRALLQLISVFVLTVGLALNAQAQSAGPLAGKVFGGGNAGLVVVLHGDVSSGGAADYHYDIAQKIASQNKGVTVLAMLRPGYSDGMGQKSKGSNNQRRDHYTKQNNKLVAQTIQAMAKQVGTSKIVAIGHSGGAAQLGVIIGAYPNLVDSAILVSCPCDIPRWRAMKGRKNWTKSQSPHKFTSKVPTSTRVIAITGNKDDNTNPVLAQDYVAALRAKGVQAQFISANGASHGFNAMASLVAKSAKQSLR